MKKELILLTNYFPYYKGEEYLEEEIKYLAEAFDHIVIVPTMVSQKMKVTREVPDVATVIDLPFPQGLKDKAINFLKTGPNILLSQPRLRSIGENAGSLNPYKWMYNLYFELRTDAIYQDLVRSHLLPENDGYTQLYIYSYWFYITANLGRKLKYDYYGDDSIPFISRGHGYDVNDYIKPFSFLPMRQTMLKHVDALYPVSDTSSNYLSNKFPKYADKIETRRLGVGEGNYQVSLRQPPLFVSCSTIRKLKRLDVIIDALAQLNEQGYDFKWVHIGDGPDAQKIEAMAKEKLKPSQYELIGRLPNKDVRKWYHEHNPTLFLNTSESEGVPVSVMEAMANAIPVVASDVGGTAEIVQTDVNGTLISDALKPEEAARAIEYFINLSDEAYQGYAKGAYQTWQTLCDSESLYTEFAHELAQP
ncbi:glycosyltransferase [Staphylococcus simulans]|uniref:glycosyltransferase n=1 Tax=Staphylococcus simulans TaxID=1286 RepID=UPI0021D46A64|nr:glycosyltransferase [Staphylococcus simulans]UXR33068.1 glycosyltransferase [Staphylococcus simulans]